MSKCIDIRSIDLNVCTENTFIVDTNVLLWAFYPNSTSSNPLAVTYSNFLSSLITNNKKIIIPIFNLCEAMHVIEKIEYRLYNSRNNQNIRFKQFRSITSERLRVKNILSLLLSQIENIPQINIINQNLKVITAQNFVNQFDKHKLDLFDTYLVDLSNRLHCPIITDDQDFHLTHLSSNVYTSNQNLLLGT